MARLGRGLVGGGRAGAVLGETQQGFAFAVAGGQGPAKLGPHPARGEGAPAVGGGPRGRRWCRPPLNPRPVQMRRECLPRAIPEFTGHQVDDVTRTNSHGGPHWTNTTRAPMSWTGKDGAAPRAATTRPPCTCAPCSPPKRPPASGPAGPRPRPTQGPHRPADRLRPGPTSTPSWPARARAPGPPVAARAHSSRRSGPTLARDGSRVRRMREPRRRWRGEHGATECGPELCGPRRSRTPLAFVRGS